MVHIKKTLFNLKNFNNQLCPMINLLKIYLKIVDQPDEEIVYKNEFQCFYGLCCCTYTTIMSFLSYPFRECLRCKIISQQVTEAKGEQWGENLLWCYGFVVIVVCHHVSQFVQS